MYQSRQNVFEEKGADITIDEQYWNTKKVLLSGNSQNRWFES